MNVNQDVPQQADSFMPQRLVVWMNPVSTNASRAERFVEQLKRQQTFAHISIDMTSAGDRAHNVCQLHELLDRQVEPYWLLVAGGDGTIGMAAEAIQSLKDKQRSLVCLWPFPAGNGNDISSMVHGPHGARPTLEVIKGARPMPVHPLLCKLQLPDGSLQTYTAVGYIGFGSSGETAALIGKKSRQLGARPSRLRIVRETYIVLSTFFRSRGVVIEENGKTIHLFERMITNGHRIGKNTLWPGNKLEDASYRDIYAVHKNVLSHFVTGVKLATRQIGGIVRQQSEIVTFTIKTPSYVQCDGEARLLPAGCHVEVGMAAQPIIFVRLP